MSEEFLKGKQKVTIKINQNTIFLFITQFPLISRIPYTLHMYECCVENYNEKKKREEMNINIVEL